MQAGSRHLAPGIKVGYNILTHLNKTFPFQSDPLLTLVEGVNDNDVDKLMIRK